MLYRVLCFKGKEKLSIYFLFIITSAPSAPGVLNLVVLSVHVLSSDGYKCREILCKVFFLVSRSLTFIGFSDNYPKKV